MLTCMHEYPYTAEAKPTKTTHLDLSFLTDLPDVKSKRDWVHVNEDKRQANSNGPVLDDDLIADKQLMDAINNRKQYKKEVCNTPCVCPCCF